MQEHSQEEELPLELDFDDYAQTNWEARAIFNRSSSSNRRDSGLLGMGDGSQAEWEARACWDLPSRRPSQDLPLEGSAINQHQTGQGSMDMPTVFQQEKDVATMFTQGTSNEGQLGLQRVTKQAAATAALQKALSNIQYIATGSQKARAAAAGASAEVEADALLQALQPDVGLLQGCSQVAAGSEASGNMAVSVHQDARLVSQDRQCVAMPKGSTHNQMDNTADISSMQEAAAAAQQGSENSTHEQMGNLGDTSFIQAAEAPQQGLQPGAAECSLAEDSSSNGSHFSLDTDYCLDQTFDKASSTIYAATQVVKSAEEDRDSRSEGSAEHTGNASLWSALPIPHPGDGQYLVDPPASLSAAESGAPAQADSVLIAQHQAMLASQLSLSTQPPVASAACVAPEQLGREASSIQLLSLGRHSPEIATAASADSRALWTAQVLTHPVTAGWQASATTLPHSQVQSVAGVLPEAVPLQGWSSSGTFSTAALQQGQKSSIISLPSGALSLDNWSPRVAQQPVLPVSSAGHSQQVSEDLTDPETTALHRAELMAHGSHVLWPDQQMRDEQPDAGNILAENARTTDSAGTLMPQVSRCSVCSAEHLLAAADDA